MTASSIRLYALIAVSAFALALPARAVDSPSPMADKPKPPTAAPKDPAASKATNIKKKTLNDYNLSSSFTSRRIIGLPSKVENWGWNDTTSSLE